MNYAFLIDNRRCIGCHACSVACKAEHEVPLGVARTWVKYVEKGVFPETRRTFQVTRCKVLKGFSSGPLVQSSPEFVTSRRCGSVVWLDSQGGFVRSKGGFSLGKVVIAFGQSQLDINIRNCRLPKSLKLWDRFGKTLGPQQHVSECQMCFGVVRPSP